MASERREGSGPNPTGGTRRDTLQGLSLARAQDLLPAQPKPEPRIGQGQVDDYPES